jgi:hypothetical protein
MFIYSKTNLAQYLNYKITGIVKDELGKPVANLFVDAFDSDFGTSEDYIGKAVTNAQGRFEIAFDDKAYKENFELLERNPDLFLTIRDSYRLLHRSEIRSEARGPEVFFEIILRQQIAFDDPYANTLQRTISTFNSIGDTVDISQVDVLTSLRQMVRALGNWSYYTTPKIMEFYGYPGPQVPRYPKRITHQHTLQWNKDGTRVNTTHSPDKISPENLALDGSAVHATNRGKVDVV